LSSILERLVEKDAARPDENSVFVSAGRWVVLHGSKILALSLVVVVPCFWHARIEAGDLGSHTYNAWLAQLIDRGQVSGLTIVWMWHNVLFDFLLTGFGKFLLLHTAEKVAVSLAVLIFFWGGFSFVAAISGRAPWFLVPCLVMFSYGWTFEAGFMNYYLSLGISFFALAIFWRGQGVEKLGAWVLAFFVLLGHGVGLAWLVAASTYLGIYRTLTRRGRYALFVAGIASLVVLRWFFYHYYVADPEKDPFYWFTGADQLVLASPRYWIVADAFLLLSGVFVVWDFVAGKHDPSHGDSVGISIHLYLLSVGGAFLLPDGIHLSPYSAALALITPRLTLIAAITLCCWLGALRARAIHLASFTILAMAFLVMLYRDTGQLSLMEAQVEQLVRTIPPTQRVLGTILPPPNSRFIVQHILDRACIGHCFSYGNYEPASGAFRIRVLEKNPYVMEDGEFTSEMEDGTYLVQPEDLPAYQVYQCGPRYADLCLRALMSGEPNDKGAFHPDL
jgi:hypothetical protein